MPSHYLNLYHPLCSCPQTYPASGSFPMSRLFAMGGHNIGLSASNQCLQRTHRTDLLLDGLVGSPCSPREMIQRNRNKKCIKNPPGNESPRPDGFTSEFYHRLRGEQKHILLKCFQKITEEDKWPNSFCKTNITPIPKPGNNVTRKENHRQSHWWT